MKNQNIQYLIVTSFLREGITIVLQDSIGVDRDSQLLPSLEIKDFFGFFVGMLC